jgi:hypothetical protein
MINLISQSKISLIIFAMYFVLIPLKVTGQVDNAKFITQSVPDRMSPGQTYNLIVTFENNGTTYWTPGEYRLRVTSGDNPPNYVWSTSDLDLVKIIEPGNTASFEVKVTAPSNEGVYLFTAQLLRGNYPFGETNKPVDVTVSRQVSYNDALNSSAFVEQTVPSVMDAGRPYKVTISMTNTGKTVWTPGNYRLVMLDAAGNAYSGSAWNTYSVGVDESIAPGGSKVFTFDLIPLLPGNYTVQWRMAASDIGLFGDASKSSVVTVNKIEETKKNEGKRGKE